MKIQNNLSAMNTANKLGISTKSKSKSIGKLSSGYRVNSSADDAAGLAISEKMRGQIRGLGRAVLNIRDGMSLINVADGILDEITDMVQRIRELSVQGASDANETSVDRASIQKEIDQLIDEVDKTASSAKYNNIKLFDGSTIGEIMYDTPSYRTEIKKDPAFIYADSPFEAMQILNGSNLDYTTSSSVTIPGYSKPSYLLDLEGPPLNFPTDGLFAVQMQDSRGAYNIVLDFADKNSAGTFNLNDFESYFQDAFTDLGIDATFTVLPSGQIEVVGVEEIGTQARVSIGVNSPSTLNSSTSTLYYPGHTSVNSSARFVNSSIFGATDSISYIESSGIQLSRPLTASEVSNLKTYGIDAEISPGVRLWDLMPPSSGVTFTLEEIIRDEKGSVIRYDTLGSYTLSKQGFSPGASTTPFADFLSAVNNLAPNEHFSSFSTGASFNIDRDGNAYIAIGVGVSKQPAYSNSKYIFSRTLPNGSNITGFHPSEKYHNSASSSPSVTSAYNAEISKVGELNVTVSDTNVPSALASAVATIDFSALNITSLKNPADLFDPNTLIGQINMRLNSIPPSPLPLFTNSSYDSAFPVAKADINSSGKLVITAAERSFSLAITEAMTDKPMFSRSPSLYDSGTSWSNTLTVTDDYGKETNLSIEPGDYKNIDSFIEKNKENFRKQGFTLSKYDSGSGPSLLITSIGTGKEYTVDKIRFNSAVSGYTRTLTYPTSSYIDELFQKIGYKNTPPEKFIDGFTHPPKQIMLDREALWMEVLPKDFWIQGGPNSEEGLFIELPLINSSILGLNSAHWDKTDFNSYHLRSKIGIKLYGNEDPSTAKFGLSVMTHEDASEAIEISENAIKIVSQERARLGATSNRLEHKAGASAEYNANLVNAESRIRDVDMAKEASALVKESIIQEAATALLAQVNAHPQTVLQLLQ